MEEDIADPRGSNYLNYKTLAGKRKDIHHKEAEPRAKKVEVPEGWKYTKQAGT